MTRKVTSRRDFPIYCRVRDWIWGEKLTPAIYLTQRWIPLLSPDLGWEPGDWEMENLVSMCKQKLNSSSPGESRLGQWRRIQVDGRAEEKKEKSKENWKCLINCFKHLEKKIRKLETYLSKPAFPAKGTSPLIFFSFCEGHCFAFEIVSLCISDCLTLWAGLIVLESKVGATATLQIFSIFIRLYVYGCSVCVPVSSATHVPGDWGDPPPGTGATDSNELPCGCWESHPGILEEEPGISAFNCWMISPAKEYFMWL